MFFLPMIDRPRGHSSLMKCEQFDLEGAVDFVSSFKDIINMNIVDMFLDEQRSKISCFCITQEMMRFSELELVQLASGIYQELFSMPGGLSAEMSEFLNGVRKFSLHNTLRYTEPAPQARLGRLNERKSDKKRHEVDRLAHLIVSQLSDQPENLAVDFGAGQGYLSQALADAGWDVVALERDDGQCHGSLVRQAASGHAPYRLRQLNIDASTTVNDLADVVSDVKHACFCSLHACGSLSINMIRLFINDNKASLLANVGCCYNLMREADCPPLSHRLESYAETLGWMKERMARMLACQAPWRWASRPMQSLQSFRSNHYRALFQAHVLPKLGLLDVELGHMPTSSLTCFASYVTAACAKIGVNIPADLDWSQIEETHDIKRTAVIWTLRALLGPVVESILLLDRYYWVKEALGEQCQLIPLFDPVQSPRNFVLLAMK